MFVAICKDSWGGYDAAAFDTKEELGEWLADEFAFDEEVELPEGLQVFDLSTALEVAVHPITEEKEVVTKHVRTVVRVG